MACGVCVKNVRLLTGWDTTMAIAPGLHLRNNFLRSQTTFRCTEIFGVLRKNGWTITH